MWCSSDRDNPGLLNYHHTDLDDIILKTKQQHHHDGWGPLLLQELRHSMVAGLCSSNHWAGTQPPKCSALELNCSDFILLTSTSNNTWLWWWSLVMKLLICRDWQLTRSKLAGQTPPALPCETRCGSRGEMNDSHFYLPLPWDSNLIGFSPTLAP